MTEAPAKPRVLVVDDNADAATTLGFLLETAGYEVATCTDPHAAPDLAAKFAPDACVLDINMPGMDGYELARRLREKDPDHAPVLATVTAYEDYGHLEKAVDAGFELHFTKPANYREVADQLADEIKKSHARPNVPLKPEYVETPASRTLWTGFAVAGLVGVVALGVAVVTLT